MKNIVLIIDNLIGGGAQTSIIRLAEAFIEKGYFVDLIVIKNLIDFNVNSNVNIITLNYKKSKIPFVSNIIYAKTLKKTLKKIELNRGEINLVIGSLGLSHSLMDIIGDHKFYYMLHGITTIAKLNNRKGIIRYLKKIKLKNRYNNKKILCVSQGVQNDILSLGVSPLLIKTIYNFFDFSKILSMSKENVDYTLPDNYIIHVGRFSKVKRHDILIHSFNLLTDKSLKLILVGEGEEKNNIVTLIKELSLENRVILFGFKKNPYVAIKNARALVLCSDHEGFGNVLVESLILDTVAISTDCPYGPCEILSEGFNSYLTPSSNPSDLAKCIELNLNNKFLIQKRKLLKFEKNTVLKEYEDLFQ